MTADRVERRLAAVLAADVAGYSRLMGIDEEGTLAELKSIRKSLVDPDIAAHRGRVVKTTGDGLLVEFASAVDAVRCGGSTGSYFDFETRTAGSDYRRLPLRAYLVSLPAVLLTAFLKLFFFEPFLAALPDFFEADFFAVPPTAFFAAFLVAFLVVFLLAAFAARFGPARFFLGAGGTTVGGTIIGSETRPSAASGI